VTKPATATEAQIKRAIRAAISCGLRVKGVAIDGTVLVDSEEEPTKIEKPEPFARKWLDDEG